MKRKICIYCDKWESGGIESFVSNILRHMDLDGLEIDVAAARLGESVFTEGLRERGVNFIELSGSQYRLGKNYGRFRKLLSKKRYDVLHLNVFHGVSLYYAVLARRAGVPVRIAHAHGTGLRDCRTKALKLALHRLFRGLFAGDATAFWACSGAAAEFVFPEKLLRERGYRMIPNGVDLEKFRFSPKIRTEERAKLNLTGGPLVGHVGSLYSLKNQSFLLEAFSELLKKRSDAKLLLVGDGKDRGMLEEQAKRLGIAENVIFYGTSSRVERLLCAMDVFAFPSRFEGLPFTLVEAQAAGLPILCSASVTEEAKLTPLFHALPLSDGPARWSEALLELLEAPAERDRAEYTGEVKNAGFDVRNVAARVGKCYRGEAPAGS